MEYKDYYKALGVPRTATQADIKKAYRKLARAHHPDLKPGDRAAEVRFKDINEANEVLSDPAKRAQYDTLGSNWEAYSRAGAGAGWRRGRGRFRPGRAVRRVRRVRAGRRRVRGRAPAPERRAASATSSGRPAATPAASATSSGCSSGAVTRRASRVPARGGVVRMARGTGPRPSRPSST